MTQDSNIGGGDSKRVGGVHFDIGLKGTEQVKQEVSETAQTVTGQFAPAMDKAAAATDKTSESMGRAGKAADGFSEKGLVGMLLKLSALRRGMIELADVFDIIHDRMKTGGDKASALFSEQGLSGAESRMKEIAKAAERGGSALANASDALRNMASLNLSGIVGMFTEPARMMEEQNRLSILAGKERAKQHEKEMEERRAAIQAENDAVIYRMGVMADEESARRQREEQDYLRQLQREKQDEAEAWEARLEKEKKAAEAYTKKVAEDLSRIMESIQNGAFGVAGTGGSTDALLNVLQSIDRKTERQ